MSSLTLHFLSHCSFKADIYFVMPIFVGVNYIQYSIFSCVAGNDKSPI